jgi:cell division protein FtsB
VAGPDPGRLLLDKIEAREQALAREAEQARTMMDDLAARVRELDEAIDHLQDPALPRGRARHRARTG